MDLIHDAHKALELPRAMVNAEIKALQQQMQSTLGQQAGSNPLPDDLFAEEAQRRVLLGLVIGEIVREHKIKLDDNKVQSLLEDIAAGYDDPKQVISYYRSHPEHMDSLRASVMEEQVVEWVKGQTKVSQKASTFEAIMHPKTQDEAA
jgi:trigger factor